MRRKLKRIGIELVFVSVMYPLQHIQFAGKRGVNTSSGMPLASVRQHPLQYLQVSGIRSQKAGVVIPFPPAAIHESRPAYPRHGLHATPPSHLPLIPDWMDFRHRISRQSTRPLPPYHILISHKSRDMEHQFRRQILQSPFLTGSRIGIHLAIRHPIPTYIQHRNMNI
jgi:hypothetical protein